MNPFGRILIIDDHPAFTATYRDILQSEGYIVESAATDEEARLRLADPDWDVVLLDRYMRGGGGPDSAPDLLAEITSRVPGARVIVVTGLPDAASVAQSFQAGAYDYLEKTAYLEPMLRVKVRNAIEAIRERRLSALANGERESAILDYWQRTRSEADPHRKGALLEDLVALLFRSIRGFEQTTTPRRRTLDEEIDILIRNESTDPYWHKQSPYLLGECKNWSKAKAGRVDYDAFRAKIERRAGQSSMGFFICLKGFSPEFLSAQATAREKGTLVVPIDSNGIQALIESGDRNGALKRLCDVAVLGDS
jgi:DNA-binding NarL/FixJ family response regulator